MSYLWSKIECWQDMLMLRPWRPPRVIQLETLVTEIGPAVSAALSGLPSLRRLTKLAHHSHTAQTHCVSVPGGGERAARVRLLQPLVTWCVQL